MREAHIAVPVLTPVHDTDNDETSSTSTVKRSDLLNQVFSDHARVVVFVGPAGHGKTSLMLQAREACSKRGYAAGWLWLKGSDNDLNRFLQRLKSLTAKLDAQRHTEPESATYEPEEATISSASDRAISRIMQIGRPVAIFLDDLHNVTGHATMALLREMITNSPKRIRWFVSSRFTPDIGLPRLVVGNQALVIQGANLRFTRNEIIRFFATDKNLALNDSEIDTIFEATEGWPAAAQLYRLALRDESVRASIGRNKQLHLREMSGYLAENVLARQDADIQDFLLKTSILTHLRPSLCDELLSQHDSLKKLAELERLGLFVRRLDSEDHCFCYHALFSKFLQERLALVFPDLVRDLHQRAASWYRSKGYCEEAMYHFTNAGAYDQACAIFNEWASSLITDGYLATVDHWFSQIPLESINEFPELATKIVWALAFLGRSQEKLQPLMPVVKDHLSAPATAIDNSIAFCMVRILEDDLSGSLEFLGQIRLDCDETERFRLFGLAAAANARGYAAMSAGKFDEALELLSQGRILSERSNAAFTMAYSLAKIGIVYFSQGYLREALIHFRSSMTDSKMFGDESVSKACLACAYIMALYEVDDFDGALEHFNQYRPMIEEAGLHDYLAVCYRAVARIHYEQGNSDQALHTLDVAERRAYSCNWPRVVNLVNLERVRIRILEGHLDGAKGILARITRPSPNKSPDAAIRFSEETEDEMIGTARLLIHDGRHDQALRVIQKDLKSPDTANRIARRIKLSLLAALAWQGCGDENNAQRSLCTATELAAPDGYLRSFLDEGPLLAQLAQRCLNLQTEQPKSLLDKKSLEFLRSIVEKSGLRAAGVNYLVERPESIGTLFLPHALTRKETKVLEMLVAYMSNEEIAKSLFVGRDTVKYHIKNIYSKLGVKNRLEAIRKALELGLASDS